LTSSCLFLNKMSRIPAEEFQQLYCDKKMKMSEIAAHFNTTIYYLHRLRKRYGIPRRNKGEPNFKPETLKKIETINELYLQGLHPRVIAENLGITEKALRTFCWIHQIKSKGQQYWSPYSINERFFSNWSNEMAWALGWILTDGVIVFQGIVHQLKFQITDKEVVEKIRTIMGSTHPITDVKPYGNSKKVQYRILISNQNIIKDLARLNIVKRKSLIVKMPEMPAEYFGHFLRGVFEGDGSIHINHRSKSGEPSYRVKIVSGSKLFIEGLQRKMIELHGLSSSLHKDRAREFYELNWNSANDIYKMGRIMYEGVSDNLILARKRNIFHEFQTTQYKRFLDKRKMVQGAAEAPHHKSAGQAG